MGAPGGPRRAWPFGSTFSDQLPAVNSQIALLGQPKLISITRFDNGSSGRSDFATLRTYRDQHQDHHAQDQAASGTIPGDGPARRVR